MVASLALCGHGAERSFDDEHLARLRGFAPGSRPDLHRHSPIFLLDDLASISRTMGLWTMPLRVSRVNTIRAPAD